MTYDAAVEILYEDGPCLVVMKPPGVLTQAPPGIDSLEQRVKTLLKHREQREGNVYLGVPHRLDRPASGVLLLGRHTRATRRLGEQFEKRLIRKVYWSLVEGQVQPDEGTWTDHIRKIPEQPRAELVDPHHPQGKLAVLHYRVLARDATTTLLEIELETGRTHQIRVQAAARGHPIWGDGQYGSQLEFGPPCADPRERAIALHAGRIGFRHPMTRESVSVAARPPEFWPEYWVRGIGLLRIFEIFRISDSSTEYGTET